MTDKFSKATISLLEGKHVPDLISKVVKYLDSTSPYLSSPRLELFFSNIGLAYHSAFAETDIMSTLNRFSWFSQQSDPPAYTPQPISATSPRNIRSSGSSVADQDRIPEISNPAQDRVLDAKSVGSDRRRLELEKGILEKKKGSIESASAYSEKNTPERLQKISPPKEGNGSFSSNLTQERPKRRTCCGCAWIFQSSRPCCLAAFFLITAALVAGIIVTAVLLTRRDNPASASSSSTTTFTSIVQSTQTLPFTVTSTTTSITTSVVIATTTSSSTQPTSAFYLGGFDAVEQDDDNHMFYTDQDGSIQHIINDGYGDWYRATETTMGSNVKPGSPIAASLAIDSSGDYTAIHVYYIDNESTIQGMIKRCDYTSLEAWNIDPIGSLALKVGPSMFIRSCVPDSHNYTYGEDADLYMYFASPGGKIRKFGWWYSTGPAVDGWKELFDLPPVTLGREVECELAGGIESLWIVNNETKLVEQWWRSAADGKNWTLGISGVDQVHPQTSLLSLSSSETNRSHIIFQAANLDIARYDISGLGSNAVLENSVVIHSSSATPGTRLTTWANSGYCGMYVSVYYQQSNTSDLYYNEFSDLCDYEGNCYVSPSYSSGDDDDERMPLVRTYGKNVSHKKKFTGWKGYHAGYGLCMPLKKVKPLAAQKIIPIVCVDSMDKPDPLINAIRNSGLNAVIDCTAACNDSHNFLPGGR
ncbi:uncharacterized protein Z518_05061 [Rhinocladiella mackenziei CBS 650.93]|uniref:Fucose-specific lectin n=1 Tax=Rhinocladiella mackenziei CBS 650.93 TaxID=1442369 RepID=A0A0D2IMT3_9EURO|nr:uncharacterized protein Z518_05061 [Rhinocladiella mackenziei CBS 650.93]KIX07084.1 hypothetical protein Z518_05061 [Rhinocladiella mackenziei CBS 650.93]